jgi:hypothetical protein
VAALKPAPFEMASRLIDEVVKNVAARMVAFTRGSSTEDRNAKLTEAFDWVEGVISACTSKGTSAAATAACARQALLQVRKTVSSGASPTMVIRRLGAPAGGARSAAKPSAAAPGPAGARPPPAPGGSLPKPDRAMNDVVEAARSLPLGEFVAMVDGHIGTKLPRCTSQAGSVLCSR